MLRRVACARAGRSVATAYVSSSSPSNLMRSHLLVGAPSRYLAAALPLMRTPQRSFSSRSDDEAPKKGAVNAKQSTTAAATNTAATAAVTAAQVFATNEKVTVSTSDEFSSSGTNRNHAQKEQDDAVPSTGAPSAAGVSDIRSIGIKLSEDDELLRAFNNFSKSVNGCTQEEFLVGVKQAYASLAVVISAFVEKAQQPLVGLTESSKVIAAAHEAAKLLDQEFRPDNTNISAKKSGAAGVDGEVGSATAAGTAGAKVRAEDIIAAPVSSSPKSSPKTKLQDTLVEHVVSTITSIIPVSRHLAESIFKIWMLQKEKQVNLSSIASPADYVLDSKLVIFARLDKARIYFNSDNIGAEVDVTLNNDYLRKLDPNVTPSKGGNAALASSPPKDGVRTDASNEKGGKMSAASSKVNNEDDDDLDEGMIQVLTDTSANAQRTDAEEHTFVVDKKTRKLKQKSRMTNVQLNAASTAEAKPSATADKIAAEGKSNTISRVQVTCVKASENVAAAATADASAKGGQATVAEAADPDACSVFIKVNGNALPPIPADARACALLTVDVVVPPERYAYNFEWFYKRIVGYENEYERIAAARVFASNSPKSLGNFLDFVMRMITGKSVEFMFSKSIGRMIGIPEDVSETPPATRKLMCMYMDASHKWVLADLITLAPVIESKLPKA